MLELVFSQLDDASIDGSILNSSVNHPQLDDLSFYSCIPKRFLKSKLDNFERADKKSRREERKETRIFSKMNKPLK